MVYMFREYLKLIRRGDVSLNECLEEIKRLVTAMDKLYIESTLQNIPDTKIVWEFYLDNLDYIRNVFTDYSINQSPVLKTNFDMKRVDKFTDKLYNDIDSLITYLRSKYESK